MHPAQQVGAGPRGVRGPGGPAAAGTVPPVSAHVPAMPGSTQHPPPTLHPKAHSQAPKPPSLCTPHSSLCTHMIQPPHRCLSAT